MVPLLSSALFAVVAIPIPGVIVVLVVAILVVAAHVMQVVGDRIVIPWMKIGRNIGMRRRISNRAGGGGGRTASAPSIHPIATRSKNCTRSGSR